MLAIGPYRGHRRLASGAGGEVWEADGPGGAAALKIARTDAQRGALAREIAVLGRLDHPYVVRCLDADAEEGWMAMELLPGPDAAGWARGRSCAEIAEFGARVAEGLAHLHARGVVHRDIKPENILAVGDEPRLIDLGLARAPSDGPEPGSFEGTLGYAAPEQLSLREGSAAADVYALGAVLYRLLTGRPPFAADDPAALAWLPLHSLPEPPSSLLPELPRALETLVLSALARNPRRRPEAAAMSARLRAAGGAPGRVVLGMSRVREPLRQAVVALSEGRGGVIVLHGSEGSGRKTLIREAAAAALREGIPVITRPRPGADLLETIAGGGPSVLPLDGGTALARRACELVLTERRAVLCLVRADRPLLALGRLGARHLAPPPLGVEEVGQLMAIWRHDPIHAAILHRVTRGLPGALVGQLRRSRRPSSLSEQERELLEATAEAAVPIPELAERLSLSELALVDLAEPLLDRGLLVEIDGGASLRAAR